MRPAEEEEAVAAARSPREQPFGALTSSTDSLLAEIAQPAGLVSVTVPDDGGWGAIVYILLSGRGAGRGLDHLADPGFWGLYRSSSALWTGCSERRPTPRHCGRGLG